MDRYELFLKEQERMFQDVELLERDAAKAEFIAVLRKARRASGPTPKDLQKLREDLTGVFLNCGFSKTRAVIKARRIATAAYEGGFLRAEKPAP